MSADLQHMSDEQNEILLQFHEFTGIDDLKNCEDILVQHNWDIETAVRSTLNTPDSDQYSRNQHEATDTAPQPFSLEGSPVDEMPIGSLFDENSSDDDSFIGPINLSAEARKMHSMLPHQTLFDWLLSLPRQAFRRASEFFNGLSKYVRKFFFSASPTVVFDPLDDVKSFISEFDETYSLISDVLNFTDGSYETAQKLAKQELKFLLIYLHDPNCKDIDPFCFGTLCNPDVVEFINENLVLWGCSIDKPEGSRVANELLNYKYPCLTLSCMHQGGMAVVAKINGQITAEELISRLNDVIAVYQPQLDVIRAERANLDVNKLIREEQDQEYQKSLEIDRQKSEQLAIRREMENMKLAEKTKLKEAKLQRRDDFLARKESCKLLLTGEPPVTAPDVITLQIKFASGARLRRRFQTSDSVKLLHDYVYAQDGTPFKLQVVSCFPFRKIPHCSTNEIYSFADGSILPTLAEVGLRSNESLSIVDSWDEEETLSISSSGTSVDSHCSETNL